MLKLRAVVCLISLRFFLCVATSRHHHLLSDEFIEHINSKQSLWTAGRNFHKHTPLRYIRTLAGTIKSKRWQNYTKTTYNTDYQVLDTNFDARYQWPHCKTINDIRDQGGCGSCWAVAAVSAMTDRICIKSNGKKNFYLSADDVLSCCGWRCGMGCNGGKLEETWKYFKRVGIVTGGHYNSKQGCKPYEIKPCDHNNPGVGTQCNSRVTTPKCHKRCIADYGIFYSIDKHRGKGSYKVEGNTNIQADLFAFGPVTTYFDVYEDFFSYKHGIYRHTTGNLVGSHSVKLIGWGVENGVEYWLVANSWNTNWGDNGFFKIIRNTNECGIEENVVAGYAM